MNAEISGKFAAFTAAMTMTGLITAAVACMFNVPVPQRIVRTNPVDDACVLPRRCHRPDAGWQRGEPLESSLAQPVLFDGNVGSTMRHLVAVGDKGNSCADVPKRGETADGRHQFDEARLPGDIEGRHDATSNARRAMVAAVSGVRRNSLATRRC